MPQQPSPRTALLVLAACLGGMLIACQTEPKQDRPPSTSPAPIATVAPNIKRWAGLGLEVWITEMDLPIAKPVTPDKLAAQAQTYRQMLEVCLAAPNCKAFIVWGIDDGGYAEPPFVQGSNARGTYAAPLLFDEAFRPKPAYDALAEVLRSR